ncbi:MAG TPA: DUF3943 domain-containing protein [Calditrichaeota bacterium]|nr:DUF3943 domain-containing protein [Calditrichota bacterium]
MRLVLQILLIVIPVSLLPAQEKNNFYTDVTKKNIFWRDTSLTPDPALVEKYNPDKSPWTPFAEAISINIALNLFNNYVTGATYARISFESIRNNFKGGWDWDADNLITNMWGHPFQGAIYYNFARSSGYGYWTSLGVTAFGSWQWEFFMEIEPPAINDFIMTTFGGAMYGEMFYRFSNLILNESLSGGKRFWRELGAGIYNPGRLINRLIYGRSGRIVEEQLYEIEPNVGELTFGVNNVADNLDFKNGDRNFMVTLNYLYGRAFLKRSYKPMDYFRFKFVLNFGGNQPGLGQFRIHGIVLGKQKTVGNGHKLLRGLFQYIDFLHNNVYEIAGYSAALGIAWRSPYDKKHTFIANMNIGIMPMSAANSDYAPNYVVETLDSARTYNMGAGGSARFSFSWIFPIGSLSFDYSFWWVHTLQGAPGDEYIGILEPKLKFRITRHWVIGLQYLLYHRRGIYADYNNIDLRNNEQRLFLGYRF